MSNVPELFSAEITIPLTVLNIIFLNFFILSDNCHADLDVIREIQRLKSSPNIQKKI